MVTCSMSRHSSNRNVLLPMWVFDTGTWLDLSSAVNNHGPQNGQQIRTLLLYTRQNMGYGSLRVNSVKLEKEHAISLNCSPADSWVVRKNSERTWHKQPNHLHQPPSGPCTHHCHLPRFSSNGRPVSLMIVFDD